MSEEALSAINLATSLSFPSLVALAEFNWIRVRVSEIFRSGTFISQDNGKQKVWEGHQIDTLHAGWGVGGRRGWGRGFKPELVTHGSKGSPWELSSGP